jgi:hypothetical protein
VGAAGTSDKDGALNAGQRRERKMTNPDNKIGPCVRGNTHAHSLDYPLFKVKARCYLS